MGKSVKKAIFKEGTGRARRQIRKIVRHAQKNFMRANFEKIISGDMVIPNSKTIVNDWDYSDYKINYEYNRYSWWSKLASDDEFNSTKKKLTRK